MNDSGRHLKTESKSGKQKRRLLLIVAICILLSAVSAFSGVTLAKYVSVQRKNAEAYSAGLFVSSDYLKETRLSAIPSYEITGNAEVTFRLYNYELENRAKITEEDILYSVSAGNWQITVTDEAGGQVSAVSGQYKIPVSAQKTYHTITLSRPEAVPGDKVTVVLQTLMPFADELSAQFTYNGQQEPSWSLTNYADYALLRIETHNYRGNLTVSWNPAVCSPDNTNEIMRSWIDGTEGIFAAEQNTAYELIFVYNSTKNALGNNSGTGAAIALG